MYEKGIAAMGIILCLIAIATGVSALMNSTLLIFGRLSLTVLIVALILLMAMRGE